MYLTLELDAFVIILRFLHKSVLLLSFTLLQIS